jgi:hypothetical protein
MSGAKDLDIIQKEKNKKEREGEGKRRSAI